MASLIVSIISAIIALGSFIFALLSNIKASNLQKGNIELQIRIMLTDSKRQLSDVSHDIYPYVEKENLEDQEKLIYASLKIKLSTAKEELLNSYEEACMKYIDNKIDKIRFKKTYIYEIGNLMKEESTGSVLEKRASPYNAIRTVYDEWYNLEK